MSALPRLDPSFMAPGMGPYQTPRCGTAFRKATLNSVASSLAADQRRSKASITLLMAGQARMMGRTMLPNLSIPGPCGQGVGVLSAHSDYVPPSSRGSARDEARYSARGALSSLDEKITQFPESGSRGASREGGTRPPVAIDNGEEHTSSASASVASWKAVQAASTGTPVRASDGPLGRQLTRKEKNLYKKETLAEAFATHTKSFADEVGGSFGVEKLINTLSAGKILDEWLTPAMVRTYFTGVLEGVGAPEYGGSVKKKLDPSDIDYPHFDAFLHFAADMKGIHFSEMETQTLNHFLNNSDQSGSLLWRLEVVFESFGKSDKGYMLAPEFINMCRRTGLMNFKPGAFNIADAHVLFGSLGKTAVEFDGFLTLVDEVGRTLGVGRQVRHLISDAVETLDNDEFVVLRMRLNLKSAATHNGVIDWAQLFSDIDPDQSGEIAWPEFLLLCRQKLKLQAKDPELRMLFRKLDGDHSGELSIDEFVAFIMDGVIAAPAPILTKALAEAKVRVG